MVAPTDNGGSICKNSAVLFTFCRFYGIIQLIDKLEFDKGGLQNETAYILVV
jgi:hypothetical protein